MIKVVEITQIKPHPTNNSLKICQVFDGVQETTVVCGGQNTQKGMKTILAEMGDLLPSGTILKKVNLQGVDSWGMLCSAKDLQISRELGIIDLPPRIKVGTPSCELDEQLLSSSPWYSYQEVDALYWNESSQRIYVVRPGQSKPKSSQLISQTYFHDGQYHYRDFPREKEK